ncbi:hypothetical protein M513_12415 [Trichuris suis]|uniref:Uncharacterized protein n=1 Tax=Trichuris suis TaxID=68888 RepID=A0A085LP09_9BILA|nr:hypothetical protein M513_12415 [Trichuris suis]
MPKCRKCNARAKKNATQAKSNNIGAAVVQKVVQYMNSFLLYMFDKCEINYTKLSVAMKPYGDKMQSVLWNMFEHMKYYLEYLFSDLSHLCSVCGSGFMNADCARGLGSKFHVFCFPVIQFEAVQCQAVFPGTLCSQRANHMVECANVSNGSLKPSSPPTQLQVPKPWLQKLVPAANVEVFDGDRKCWPRFIASFKSVVHDSVSSDVDRLALLAQLHSPRI